MARQNPKKSRTFYKEDTEKLQPSVVSMLLNQILKTKHKAVTITLIMILILTILILLTKWHEHNAKNLRKLTKKFQCKKKRRNTKTNNRKKYKKKDK